VQRDLVVAGYFTVRAFGPSIMSVVPYPVTGRALVSNCQGSEQVVELPLQLDRIGWLSFGGGVKNGKAGGCNPALGPCVENVVGVEGVTWGGLKNRYGGDN